MNICKNCIKYDNCEYKNMEICKGNKIKDIEHNCKHFIQRSNVYDKSKHLHERNN